MLSTTTTTENETYFEQSIYRSLFLLHPDEPGGVVAAAGGLSKKGFLHLGIEAWRARENPEIVCAAAADECGGVGVVDRHNAVVGVERPEERDAQKTRRIRGLADTLRRLRLVLLRAENRPSQAE